MYLRKLAIPVIVTAMLLSLSACGGSAASAPSASAASTASAAAVIEIPAVEEASDAIAEASLAESVMEPEIIEEPEISDDDIILGENSVAVGETITLSVDTEGLSPLYSAARDTSIVSSGDAGKNVYSAAGYITEEGLQDISNPEIAEAGTITDTEATDVVIRNNASGTNGIVVSNATYAIRNADIVMDSIDNGKNTNDFIGKGAAIMATGENANVTLEDSTIEITGVARLAAMIDNGATMTIRNSSLTSHGGTLYESYHNTATTSVMVSPPWVLGIMGNSRCSNLMGTDSTLNVIESDTASGSWAGLSTDMGTNLHLNVYDSTFTMLNADESAIPMQIAGGQLLTRDNPFTTRYGAGYGSFTIGQAVETFAGATLQVGSMANIFNGGTATYTALEKGKTYTLESGSGNADIEYTATEDKNTVIESDTLGFMFHQNTNTLNVLNGTVVNSAFTGVLMKTGSSGSSATALFENSELNAGNGVLVQLMDNDDALLGGMDSTGAFYETYYEAAGFLRVPENSDRTLSDETSGAMGPGSVASTGSETADFTFRGMELSGNLYNAGGWYGGLTGIPMNITLEDTTLNGAIATTSAIHVTYEGAVAYKEREGVAFDNEEEAAAFAEAYQATEYTINEYWTMGQVANMIAYNNSNVINVTMSDGAVWNVASTSMINSLTLSGNAKVSVPAGVVLNIDGIEYTDCVLTANDAAVFGTVVEPAESAGGSGFSFNFSGPPPAGFGGAGSDAEEAAEEEIVHEYTYIWAVDSSEPATLHDNEDGTVTVTGVAPGEYKLRLDVVIDGVSAGRFVKIITIE